MRYECLHCGSNAVVKLSSIDRLVCADCKSYQIWRLKPQQKSVLIEGKVGECTQTTGKTA